MTKNKVLSIIVSVAVLLVVVFALSWIIQSAKSNDGNTADNADNVVAKVDECVLNEAITFCGDNHTQYSAAPMKFTAYSSEADNEEQVVTGNSTTLTLKLTSTVLSEVMLEKVNVPVSWRLEFVNADSAWAKGKTVTDYVTVTPKSDFTRTVTITNKAAFGEQIRLIATLENDNSKTASCVIDYVKRFSGGLQEMYCVSDFGDEMNAGGTISAQQEAVGTIMGELRAYGTYIGLEEGFTSLVQSYLKFNVQFSSYSFGQRSVSTYINYHQNYKYYAFEVTQLDEQGNGIICDYSHFITNWDSLSEAQKTAVKYAWWTAYQEYGDNLTIDIVFDYCYGDKTLGQISGYRNGYLTGECYGDGISVDGSLLNIVF